MPTDSQAGAWYVVITCANCKSTVFLFRDLNEGKRALNAMYFVTCPNCGHQAEYEARHYQ